MAFITFDLSAAVSSALSAVDAGIVVVVVVVVDVG